MTLGLSRALVGLRLTHGVALGLLEGAGVKAVPPA